MGGVIEVEVFVADYLEVESPIAVHARLPDIVCPSVFLGAKGGMANPSRSVNAVKGGRPLGTRGNRPKKTQRSQRRSGFVNHLCPLCGLRDLCGKSDGLTPSAATPRSVLARPRVPGRASASRIRRRRVLGRSGRNDPVVFS